MLEVRALAFLAFVLAGAIAGVAALPALFRTLPHDLARHGTVLHAARTERPQVVVLGNSLGEAGIDAGEFPLLNLSARGQSLEASLLLQQELAPSVTTVIQLVSYDQLDAAELPSANALWAYGCRPEESLRASIRHRLATRWVTLQFLDRLVRTRSHKPPANTDFATPLPPARFAAAIQSVGDLAPLPIETSNLRRLEAMSRLAALHHRRLLLVVPPVHPALPHEKAARCLHALRGIRGAEVVDATQLLGANEFSDPVHATPSGAKRLTRYLRQAVEARR